MSGANSTELALANWLASERQRTESRVWAFARDLAEGDESGYGDQQLERWIAGLLNGSASAELRLEELGADIDAARDLIRRLEVGTDTTEWLDDLNPTVLRIFLFQINGPDLYAHSLVKGHDPKARYRVNSPLTVQEPGPHNAVSSFGLRSSERQLCDQPIGEPCSCRVEQRERA